MLDAHVKIEILDLLRKIQEKTDLSIIFITHDLGIAKNFCNRFCILESYSYNSTNNKNHIFVILGI